MYKPRKRLLTLAAAALLLAAACTSGDDATASPTATGTPSATPTTEATASPSATASPTPAGTPEATTTAEPDLNPEPATIDSATIDGLSEVTDSHEGAPVNYDVSYPAIEGFEGFNAAVAAEVQRQLDEFRARFDPPAPLPDGTIPQKLTLTSQFLVASGDVIGVRLDTFRFFGANGASSSVTVWYDLAIDQQIPAASLLEGQDGLAEFHDLVIAAIAATRPDDPIQLATVDPTPALYHSLAFDLDGRLIVNFDEGDVAATYLGQIAVAIDRTDVEPLLSDFGRRALAETLEPSGPLVAPTS